jgi:hypothetical protein
MDEATESKLRFHQGVPVGGLWLLYVNMLAFLSSDNALLRIPLYWNLVVTVMYGLADTQTKIS